MAWSSAKKVISAAMDDVAWGREGCVIRRVAQSIPAKVVSDPCQDRRPGVVMTTGHDLRPPDIHRQRPDVGPSPIVLRHRLSSEHHQIYTYHLSLPPSFYLYNTCMRSIRTRNIIILYTYDSGLSLFSGALTAACTIYTLHVYATAVRARHSPRRGRLSRAPVSSARTVSLFRTHCSKTFHPVPTHVPRTLLSRRGASPSQINRLKPFRGKIR